MQLAHVPSEATSDITRIDANEIQRWGKNALEWSSFASGKFSLFHSEIRVFSRHLRAAIASLRLR
jgi:hypothetical protein